MAEPQMSYINRVKIRDEHGEVQPEAVMLCVDWNYVFTNEDWTETLKDRLGQVSGDLVQRIEKIEQDASYAISNTDAEDINKVAELEGYQLKYGKLIAVKFINNVPASATLNINNQGAKPIYYQDNPIDAKTISAGTIGFFVYDGEKYKLIVADNTEERLATLEEAIQKSLTDAIEDLEDRIGELEDAFSTKIDKAVESLVGVAPENPYDGIPVVEEEEDGRNIQKADILAIIARKYSEMNNENDLNI